jgi:DNA processing protein
MKYSDSAINVLAARIYKGIGRAWIVKNLTSIKSENEIVVLLKKDSKVDYAITLDDFQKKKDFIKRLLHESEGFIDGIVAVGDDDFPSHRGIVKNSEKPVFLFYRGDISLLNTSKKNVAVIGLLDPDNDTEEVEKKVVAGLVDNDVTIISGLAFGCDTVAHRQALDSKGRTVAILPSPLNKILPAKNKDLANEIVKNGGLIVTEYLTDAKSRMELGGRYQERDRLQALFSDSIILSASYAKNDLGNDSGSRLAMEYALNYSIPRSVIYDPIVNKNNKKYDLNRKIIEEDSGVTVINFDNMSSVIKKIISIKSKMTESQPQPIQKSMF